MIIEFLSIPVQRGKRAEFAKALAALVDPIQLQPGCLGCRLFESWPSQERLQIQVRWDSHEHLVRYLQSQIYKKLLLFMELSPAPPTVEFFLVVEERGLDLVASSRTSPE